MGEGKELKKAVDYLISRSVDQISTAYNFQDEECTKKIRKIDVVFTNAFTIHALQSLPANFRSSKIDKFIEDNCRFLLEQSKDKYSFCYWTRNSIWNKKFPLPDDVDDTAICLSALIKSKKEINEKYFFKIIQLEVEAGGPYITWYVDKNNPDHKIWTDIDPTVNTHILYFTSLFGINLKKTRNYVLSSLRKNLVSSPYYPYNLTFYFNASKYVSVSRDYMLKNKLIKNLEKINFLKLKPMERILFCLSKMYLEMGVSEYEMNQICKLQGKNGALPALPLCFDYPFKGRRTYTGSKILSTSLLIELLSLYKREPVVSTAKRKEPIIISKFVNISQRQIKEELQISPSLYKKLNIFDLTKESKPISMPIYIALSIKPKLSEEDLQVLTHLSVAMYFGWNSYTILDKILDNEYKSDYFPLVANLINLSWKYLFRLNKHLNPTSNFLERMYQGFMVCDENYGWEIKNARFKSLNTKLKTIDNYDYIRKRMEPYLVALSSLPELLKIKKKNVSKNIYDICKSVVIIDQLGDDGHDYDIDMKNGIMTYVLSKIYKLDQRFENINKVFWKYVIHDVIKDCEKEYHSALESIDQIGPKTNFLRDILEKSIKPINDAKMEIEKTNRILNSFS